jgi:mono/diheme cytochrome c family protein
MRLLGLSLLLAAACGQGPSAGEQGPLSRDELVTSEPLPGESTYRRYCIGCHGADGRGNGGITGADLTAASGPLALKSDAELVASVRDGKRGARATMPAHGPVLTPAQLSDVVGYVKQRFAPNRPRP